MHQCYVYYKIYSFSSEMTTLKTCLPSFALTSWTVSNASRLCSNGKTWLMRDFISTRPLSSSDMASSKQLVVYLQVPVIVIVRATKHFISIPGSITSDVELLGANIHYWESRHLAIKQSDLHVY
ncbi:uncharacterized protein PV07_01042 [Cladophialophora immunda]|uniref:Uncharacterized protein n=1 Tax=Cladophialophora immunda TaxID=569365 RepID=A0A0D2CWH9_9EURO|nr:uncharacterized protein PV07_01042 [Cladophialophora immunda]KIW34250.1 hypothetical protein PV07_01042 [Cladophialophora immunda]